MSVWPLTVYFALVILVVAGMLALSYVLGQRHNERATGAQYESGIRSEGSARVRLSVKFLLGSHVLRHFRPGSHFHISLGHCRPRAGLGWLL